MNIRPCNWPDGHHIAPPPQAPFGHGFLLGIALALIAWAVIVAVVWCCWGWS
jgi:hypothetical protein